MDAHRIGAINIGMQEPNWAAYERVVKDLGYESEGVERTGFRFWHPDRMRGLRGTGTRYVDGWTMNRCFLGKERTVVAPLPRRSYFTSGEPDRRPEHVILAGAPKPEAPSSSSQITALRELIEHLESSSQAGSPIGIRVDTSVRAEFVYMGGPGVMSPASIRQVDHYLAHGFRTNHKDARLQFIWEENSTNDRGPAIAMEFKDRIHELARWMHIDPPRMARSPLRAFIDRLESTGFTGMDERAKHLAVVLLLDVRNDGQPSPGMRGLMAELDRRGIRWRRALYSDDRKWSIRNQFPSLMSATGAIPHAVARTDGEDMPWFIGLDASHARPGTCLCAALVEPGGMLHSAWTCPHPRSESFAPDAVRRLLRKAMNAVRAEDSGAGVVVVRDGRLFERENAGFYREHAPCRCSLVEVRKRNNPVVYSTGAGSTQPTEPSVASLQPTEDQEFHLLTVHGGRNLLEQPLKVTWKREWDGLGLGESLPRLLYGQTLGSGLGLDHPPRRLPAPIYWADGIAGASDDDLRFRGQNIHLVTDP